MRMVVYQRAGDRSPVGPPTPQELARHRWHATRRGMVSFAGSPDSSGGGSTALLLVLGLLVGIDLWRRNG